MPEMGGRDHHYSLRGEGKSVIITLEGRKRSSLKPERGGRGRHDSLRGEREIIIKA